MKAESWDDGPAVRSLEELHESEDNPREISDERFDALKYALAKDPDMMQARPIIATPDGEVVCGNMRLRALRDLGWTEAPVFTKSLSDAQKREWMLRDNQEYGDWVPDQLADLLARHRDEDGDMALLGFGERQMDGMLKMHDSDGSPGNGRPGQGSETPEVWGLIVECETETQQAELAEELSDRGLEVRALIPD
jgi:hypothetical protein